jgi:hypothetical protein
MSGELESAADEIESDDQRREVSAGGGINPGKRAGKGHGITSERARGDGEESLSEPDVLLASA